VKLGSDRKQNPTSGPRKTWGSFQHKSRRSITAAGLWTYFSHVLLTI